MNTCVNKVCFALLLTGLLSHPALAEMRYVSPAGLHSPPFTNWTDAATNIQSAINACQFGDTVIVTDGIYVLTSTLRVTNNVMLKSENGQPSVLINGNAPVLGSDAVFLQYGFLDGLTISNAGRHGVKSEFGSVNNCLITHSASNGIDSFTTPQSLRIPACSSPTLRFGRAARGVSSHAPWTPG